MYKVKVKQYIKDYPEEQEYIVDTIPQVGTMLQMLEKTSGHKIEFVIIPTLAVCGVLVEHMDEAEDLPFV